LGDSAAQLAALHPPLAALRAWLLLFVDYLAAKKIMAAAINTTVTGDLAATSAQILTDAITLLTDRAVSEGAITLTLPPLDLLRAITGVANSFPDEAWDASARAMVDVLIAGMTVR
jgi:hypothetical protein